jgi:hypothetical protein
MTKTNQECFDAIIQQMRDALKDNNVSKGNSWRFKSENHLIDMLMQKVHEFEISNDDDLDQTLVDLMNYCYLLWAKRKYFKGV